VARAEVESKYCKGCLRCVEICPKDCLALSGKTNDSGYDYIEYREDSPCIGCGLCYMVCPDCAISVYK